MSRNITIMDDCKKCGASIVVAISISGFGDPPVVEVECSNPECKHINTITVPSPSIPNDPVGDLGP